MNRLMTFDKYRVFETEFAGRPLKVETGKMTQLANGACLVHYGDTTVHVAVTASEKPREGVDFFPLSVDYEEKMYAVGKIPGSYLKREGRPSEKAILTSRVIDRPIRPLFDKSMRNDVSIVCTVMSVDPDCQPEIVAMIGASIAISISDVPWNGPISGCSVGMIDGEYIINPTEEQRKVSQMATTVASTSTRIAMIEAGANCVSDDDMYNAIMAGHEANQKIISFIEEIKAEIGKPKFEFASLEPDHDMFEAIKAFAEEDVKVALDTDDKRIRDERLKPIYEAVHAKFDEIYPESEALIDECLYKTQKFIVRRWLLDEQKRVDGRGMDDIRPLASEVGVIPRVHGSGMFTRGQTQICNVVTLAPLSEAQKLDGLDTNVTTKRYMHHYNFPSYSVGETKPSRGPGRREIGHGALAERALLPVLPSEEEFPYAIRTVSETFESNGSTSMASTCASCMSLMAAGVPIKKMVAGISCGLVTGETDDDYVLLTDIQGLEDFFGDMDFKVTGTDAGITAIQMDIKIHGLTRPIVEGAIARCREARMYIMENCMKKAIAEPRKEVGAYAPKIVQIQIDPAKIGDVVGQRGKTINAIIEETGVKIDITDDGAVSVCGTDKAAMDKAIKYIQTIVTDYEEGLVLEGKVISIKEFGAFIEFAPGKEGMVHISKICKERIDHVEDVLTLGDKVKCVCLGKDKMGRYSFSIKDVKED